MSVSRFFRILLDEVGWLLTFLLASLAVAFLLGDTGDIYLNMVKGFQFRLIAFTRGLFLAVAATRYMLLFARWAAGRASPVRRASFLLITLVSLGVLVRIAELFIDRSPVSEVVQWHLVGFPSSYQYGGAKRFLVEFHLLAWSLVQWVWLLSGSGAALLQFRRVGQNVPAESG